MKAFFTEILQYTTIFNDKVIDSLIEAFDVPEKSFLLINHTINAHEIWNARIEEKPCFIDVWGIRSIDMLKAINKKNYEDSLSILAEYDFDKIIKYTNSKGLAFENTIRDIFFHMINHSTYHRGQIAADCKVNGITPLVTDYIFYKRDFGI